MIRRVLCFLLTISLLASQSLCWAHAHTQLESAPDDHPARPHMHIGSHDHHPHRHDHQAQHVHTHHSHTDMTASVLTYGPEQSHVESILPHRDHDCDAVYFGTADGRRDCVSVTSAGLNHANEGGRACVSCGGTPPRPGVQRVGPPSVSGLACPLYLRKLSLRL